MGVSFNHCIRWHQPIITSQACAINLWLKIWNLKKNLLLVGGILFVTLQVATIFIVAYGMGSGGRSFGDCLCFFLLQYFKSPLVTKYVMLQYFLSWLRCIHTDMHNLFLKITFKQKQYKHFVLLYRAVVHGSLRVPHASCLIWNHRSRYTRIRRLKRAGLYVTTKGGCPGYVNRLGRRAHEWLHVYKNNEWIRLKRVPVLQSAPLCEEIIIPENQHPIRIQKVIHYLPDFNAMLWHTTFRYGK